MVKMGIAFIVLLAALAGQVQAQSSEQAYPSKPIRLIVPLSPGGGTDIVARALALKLTDNLGQNVVVDNRPGAGGSIGAELAAQAVPDGYTLIMTSASAVIRPLMYRARFDLVRDFAPVSQITMQPYVIVVNPSLPVKSVGELIAFAKSNPGKLNYASAGNGSLTHLTGELLKATTGIDMVHVPYKGAGTYFPDLFSGTVHLAFGSIISVQPHIRANRVRPLAVTSAGRAKLVPEVPTAGEAGVRGFAVTQWFGVFAPAHTPRPIVERLNQEIVKVLRQPELAARLAADGAEAVGSSPQQFAAHVKAERDKWAKVIKETGIRAD